MKKSFWIWTARWDMSASELKRADAIRKPLFALLCDYCGKIKEMDDRFE
jgi:hypothetical protein